MRTATSILTAAITALLLSACSSTSSPTPAAAPDPKSEWTKAMQDAGFVPNAPHTYDEMFGSSKAFCGAGSALAISGLARTALDPSQTDTTAMPARGKNPDEAATVYGNATWKWSCGH